MLTPGTRLGPYEIRAPLGSGGMGEVYRAHDARLGRDVAIKILPGELAGDPIARARFERESRAVAALSHPNILAIHDVGNEAGLAYVVTELLDGTTLREQLRASSTRATTALPIRKAVDYALQTAQGLAASHGKGIVHRDVKPENLFVTSAGHVKILDFGLAKVESGFGTGGDASPTVVQDLPTEHGTILGTIGYLSPEQARGQTADDRSDMFSLGVVMYEMAAGERPFTGETAVDVLHRILHDEARPLGDANPQAPQELQWIVAKCLTKDPELRYQSARDLIADLKNVSRLLDSSPSVTMTARTIARQPARRSTRGLVAGGVIAIVVVSVALYVTRDRWLTPDEGFTNISIERVTTSGNVTDAEISPDGKYVAYVVSQSGQQSLWIRQPATSSTLQVVPPAAVSYWGISFARDSSALYYGQKSTADPNGAFYRVPVLGGLPHKLLAGIDSQPALAPDGKRIAYLRSAYPEAGQSALMVADADGANQRVLAVRKTPQFLAPIFFAAPTWSPDGAQILTSLETRDQRPRATLVAFRTADGVEQKFRDDAQWATGGHVTWLPDASGVVAVAADRAGGQHQLWWVSRSGAKPRAITSDLFDYRKVSVTADSQTLVAVASDNASSIWVAHMDGSGTPRRISEGRYDGLSGVSGVKGGAILYRSLESGQPEIWMIDETGGNRRQLTTEGASWPSTGADGQWMAFISARDNRNAVWRMNLDGADARQLESSGSAIYPRVSPDGTWVAYISSVDGVETLWRVPADGGSPQRLTTTAATRPAISPDGRMIALFGSSSEARGRTELLVIPSTGGPPIARFPAVLSNFATVRWTADSKALVYAPARNDRANVWLQPLSGEPPRQVTHFSDQDILGFDLSADGQRILVVRGILTRDAFRIRRSR